MHECDSVLRRGHQRAVPLATLAQQIVLERCYRDPDCSYCMWVTLPFVDGAPGCLGTLGETFSTPSPWTTEPHRAHQGEHIYMAGFDALKGFDAAEGCVP